MSNKDLKERLDYVESQLRSYIKLSKGAEEIIAFKDSIIESKDKIIYFYRKIIRANNEMIEALKTRLQKYENDEKGD